MLSCVAKAEPSLMCTELAENIVRLGTKTHKKLQKKIFAAWVSNPQPSKNAHRHFLLNFSSTRTLNYL